MAGPKGSTFIEDEIGRKWDRCLTDALLKFGGGIIIGGVFSLLFFKKRRWPVIMGGGFGIGMAYSNCERDLNTALQSQARLVPDVKCN